LAVARAAGIRTGEAEVLLNLGRLEYLEGDLNAAASALERALSISNEMGHSQGDIFALRFLGEVAYQRGDYGLARSNIEASLAHAREQRDPWRTAWAAGPLGYVLVVQGHYELARRIWVENLLAWRQLGNMNHFASTLEGLASLAARAGDRERALQLVGAAASIRRINDILMLPEARLWLDGWLPAARAKLGESRATAAWAKGEAMSVQEVIAYASGSPSSPWTDEFPAAPGELTRREREVAVLVRRGLTDRQIAHALVISGHTAHTHVRNILGKLGLQSRAQIAAWAVEEGLSAGRNRSTKNT
jgi:non-specific serine/threonine protein kinase